MLRKSCLAAIWLAVSSPVLAQECPKIPTSSTEMRIGRNDIIRIITDDNFKSWMRAATGAELDRTIKDANRFPCHERGGGNYILMWAFAYGEGMGGNTGGFMRVRPTTCDVVKKALACYQEQGWPYSRDAATRRPGNPSQEQKPGQKTSSSGLDGMFKTTSSEVRQRWRERAKDARTAWQKSCKDLPANDYCDALKEVVEAGQLSLEKTSSSEMNESAFRMSDSMDKAGDDAAMLSKLEMRMSELQCKDRVIAPECRALNQQLADALKGKPVQPNSQSTVNTASASACVKSTKDNTFGYIENSCGQAVSVKYFDLTPGKACSDGCSTAVKANGRASINYYSGMITMAACYSPASPMGFQGPQSKFQCR